MFNINELFTAARNNPANPMNRKGKLQGRHCRGRLLRAQAKRVAAGKKAYTPED